MSKEQLIAMIEEMSYEPKDQYDLGWRDAIEVIKMKVKTAE